MNITLRLEQPDDYRTVEELTREAFWGLNHPDCDEHFLAHRLRKSPGFVPELDYVAEADGKLVGNIMYSKGKVVDDSGNEYETLNFGPLSVLPAYQNSGIGKVLISHTIVEARRLGYRAILFFGHPDYYPRLGFRRASEFGITTSSGKSFDAFMAMELYGGALNGISGRYYEDPAFDIAETEAKEYDKSFPPKDRVALKPIEILLDRLDPMARDAIQGMNLTYLCRIRNRSQCELSALPGVDQNAIDTIRITMLEHGYRWGEERRD